MLTNPILQEYEMQFVAYAGLKHRPFNKQKPNLTELNAVGLLYEFDFEPEQKRL